MRLHGTMKAAEWVTWRRRRRGRMFGQVDLSQWRPTKLVEAARRAALPEFIHQLRADHLLLVKVDNFESKVARGLETPSGHPPASGSIAPSVKTRGAKLNLILARIEEARKLRGSRGRIPTTLMLEPRYLVPIRKRGTNDRTLPSSISVGRLREHDIVLHDPSVSKIHAEFLRNAEGLSLRDANSKNCTFVNSVLTTEHYVPVEHGDEVRFGEVESMICSAEHFWQIVHGL